MQYKVDRLCTAACHQMSCSAAYELVGQCLSSRHSWPGPTILAGQLRNLIAGTMRQQMASLVQLTEMSQPSNDTLQPEHLRCAPQFLAQKSKLERTIVADGRDCADDQIKLAEGIKVGPIQPSTICVPPAGCAHVLLILHERS